MLLLLLNILLLAGAMLFSLALYLEAKKARQKFYRCERQQQKLEDYTDMIVHELRAPLNVLTGTLDQLVAAQKTIDQKRILTTIKTLKQTAQDLLRLVNDHLDIAKIEAGRFEILKRPWNIKEIIQERINYFKVLAEKKKLKLKIKMAADLPRLSFDRERISQVINNLLSNSIRYTDKGSITIQVFRSFKELEKKQSIKKSLIIAVKDTGRGIPANRQQVIFSRFRQLEESAGQSGTSGLGLVISKGIVKAHGGKIWFQSQTGKGSTFYFNLPV